MIKNYKIFYGKKKKNEIELLFCQEICLKYLQYYFAYLLLENPFQSFLFR